MKLKIKIKKNGKNSHGVMRNLEEVSIRAHELSRGKVEQIGRVTIKNMKDLAVFYAPGVAYVSSAIRANKLLSYKYTGRGNRIAIISDGSRILGLGDIGPEAGLPVIEGKALLFKRFGNVDALPLAIEAASTEQIVEFAKAIEPSVGGINLEDISSGKCFDVFDRLQKELNVPVFHDDRHGTAVVVYSALINAMKLVGKDIKSARIVVNGAGAAGTGIAQLLLAAGATNIMMCDGRGIIYKGRNDNMTPTKVLLAEYTNKAQLKGQLADAAKNADILIGASTAGAFNENVIRSMAQNPVVFALAIPEPEISYERAKAAGAVIVATGNSGVPNQVNNLLAFPAVFRGALDAQARKINTAMLQAAGEELARNVKKQLLSIDHIIPNFVNEDITEVTANVAAAVSKSAIDTGVAGIRVDPADVRKNVRLTLKRYSKMETTIAKLGSEKEISRLLK